MPVWTDPGLCDECGRCIKKCSYDAIIWKNNNIKITERCTECGVCIEICKKKALFETSDKQKISLNFGNHSGVWVFIEKTLYGISKVSLEILGKAQELATKLEEKLTAIILGYRLSNSLKFLKKLGMDQILVMDNEQLKNYDCKIYADLIAKIVKAESPNIFLFGATYLGRDLAPRVAKLAKVGLTADCTDLQIHSDDKILLQTRPAFGGNLLATIVNKFSKPQMASVRAGVMAKYKCNDMRTPKIKFINYPIGNISTKILKIFKENIDSKEIDKAKIIIGGGRGMEDSDGFSLLYDLASLLHGQVVGTRVAVENNWISEKKQVGQTGITIMPSLYIACGISGAIQHRAGVLNSKFIVAINKDPNAAIFKIANWGIVGNVLDILPEFIKQLEIV